MAGFAKYILPVLIGAPDMAFPRLENILFWMLGSAVLLLLVSAFVPSHTLIQKTSDSQTLLSLGNEIMKTSTSEMSSSSKFETSF
jgi:hypothetical protein